MFKHPHRRNLSLIPENNKTPNKTSVLKQNVSGNPDGRTITLLGEFQSSKTTPVCLGIEPLCGIVISQRVLVNLTESHFESTFYIHLFSSISKGNKNTKISQPYSAIYNKIRSNEGGLICRESDDTILVLTVKHSARDGVRIELVFSVFGIDECVSHSVQDGKMIERNWKGKGSKFNELFRGFHYLTS